MTVLHGTRFSLHAICLAISLVLCVFEGAVRKWIVQDASPIVQGSLYFSKDIPLLLAAMIGLLRSTRSPVLSLVRQLLVLMTIGVIIGTLSVIDGIGSVGAVVSFRNLVLMPWVAVLVGPHLRGKWDVALVCHVAGLCTAVNAVVGAMQFVLPAEHFLNRQTSSLANVIADQGRVRASGTFAFITGMGDLCVLGAWAGVVLIGRKPWNPLGYLWVAAGLGTGSAAISRGGVFTALGLLVGLLFLSRRGRWLAVAGAVLLAGGYWLVGDQMPDEPSGEPVQLTGAVYGRAKTADNFWDRIYNTYYQVPAALMSHPTGIGLGQSQTGQKTLTETEWVYEFDLARVVYEIGVIGLLAVLLWRVVVPAVLLLKTSHLPTTELAVWRPGVCLLSFGINLTLMIDHIIATFVTVAVAFTLSVVERGYHARP